MQEMRQNEGTFMALSCQTEMPLLLLVFFHGKYFNDFKECDYVFYRCYEGTGKFHIHEVVACPSNCLSFEDGIIC
jgi:hypothetical protein